MRRRERAAGAMGVPGVLPRMPELVKRAPVEQQVHDLGLIEMSTLDDGRLRAEGHERARGLGRVLAGSHAGAEQHFGLEAVRA